MGKKCFPDFYTFADMQGRQQNFIVENDYFRYLLTVDEMMFDYDGLPENIDAFRLEDFLNLTGGVIWKVIDGVHMVAPFPARQGQIDQWGYGMDAHSTTLNGISLEGVVGKEAAVIYNNTVRCPQNDLYTDADIFTQIDSASRSNIDFARIAPMFGVGNDKQKKALEEIIKAVAMGELRAVVMSDGDMNINAPIKDSTGTQLQTIDAITAPEKIQYLQYLSQYFDIRLRRHFARRGLSLKTSDKQAQVTRDEVHGMDAMTWVYPLSKLKARQIGLEMVNKLFGTNITVKFSELWEQEWNAYKLRAAAEDTEEQAAADDLMKEGEQSADTENADGT